MASRERIVVERSFEEAKAFDELQRAELAVAWCLEQHGVQFLRSYLSLDGRSMVCLYDAPDAESVRETQRRGSLPFTRAWACSVLGDTGVDVAKPGFSTVVVERDVPAGMPREMIDGIMASSGPCFETHRVELLKSHLARDLHRMICIFAAPDAEAVRIANREGGPPFTRVWTATAHGP